MSNNLSGTNKQVNILFCLCALIIVPIYLYGIRPVLISLVAVVTALICDIVCRQIFDLKKQKMDLSSVITALIISLSMSASVNYFAVVIATVSGILIGKYVFGGSGHNIFNPAALGIAVAAISFPENVLTYPAVGAWGVNANLGGEGDIIYQSSFASILNVGGTPKTSLFDIALGNFAGPMGTTCMLVILVIMIYLLGRKIIPWQIVLTSLATSAVFAFIFPRLSTGRVNSVIFELASGIMLFGFVFLACDETTSPKTGWGQVFFGFSLALATMIFKTVGSTVTEVEIVFVILLVNALSEQFDVLAKHLTNRFSVLRFEKFKKGGDLNV